MNKLFSSLREWFSSDDEDAAPKTEVMTEKKVDFSFRIYWTKIAREWDLFRIQETQSSVKHMTEHPDFQKNLIDRRYRVEGLDDLAHSGASLLALLEVLDALEKTYEGENNGQRNDAGTAGRN